ncbi:class II fructose-1,6-bisphosphate aldolase [Helicobacter saguini]|uniref:Class II fructose-1,6-bisphosphate aldolase n=1 Tax=Helicobacter saguini TaxID=1548018 RepID=A0A347VTD3_9HELI|nr:class II fructose-bisphosphate aldolase [Helicobacter saguini]MWV62140.1 class II fructose-1,6-bisphosphate aldolase [Helicobacter saguini]MWV67188.1 class II fructose-1,6-bisphosphate aldolase [Helicobacter saguini]MWV69540.1 class II fructose-1,6-bisphosphate aldolase [Helicobacter saguini]MWV70909.1 class II fructose-1,6-bisphosphate aldolase [Helicobacter saguini]TLD92548.1 class II fructose-1,6-bisphosphate aldolase [Helicobacter saguini]
MLVSGIEILSKANKEGYGVGAFNFVDFEMLNAIFVAANEKNSPIFVQASEGAIKYMGIEIAVALVQTMAKKYPHIPVALHLDHGTSFESCKKAVDAGFTSVMIDASHHPFDENLEETSKVVKMAHERGVSVEAELGRLMGIEDNISVDEKDAVLVNPAEAEKFVRESKVDYLAPAIGTSHGAFKFKGEPRLDFERLKKVKELTKIPLVLHGASAIPDYVRASFTQSGGDIGASKGVPFSFLQEAVKGGINKVNTDTDLRIAFIAEVRKVANEDKSQFDLRKFFTPAMKAMSHVIAERMDILGSSNKI